MYVRECWVGTDKADGHAPHSNIHHVLTQLLAATSLDEIESLLPFNEQPAQCQAA